MVKRAMSNVLKRILYLDNSILSLSVQLAVSSILPPPSIDEGVSLLTVELSSEVKASKVSREMEVSRLLNLATWCKTCTAFSSRPR